jgi:tol-pal system protein YbgF
VAVAGAGRRALSGRVVALLGLTALVAGCLGCVTQGDFRKLEERVLDETQRSEDRPNPFKQIAQLSAEVDALRNDQRKLQGQLEVAEKKADRALEEARKARNQVASQSAGTAAAGSAAVGASESDDPPSAGAGVTSAEVVAYQKALEAWRGNDHKLCVDRFRTFLQTYPASAHADDGAYWMADCHFKQGDYRVAVLRFNDVVRVYPAGNKAADALYRQGESLLKLGPGFHDAARTVFEQVIEDYPDSARAKQAKKQLSVLGKG